MGEREGAVWYCVKGPSMKLRRKTQVKFREWGNEEEEDGELEGPECFSLKCIIIKSLDAQKRWSWNIVCNKSPQKE